MDSSNYTFKDHKFLAELGLEEVNNGCYYDGEWHGNGGEVVSLNPHDNKGIAKTKLASLDDFSKCIKGMESEKARWAKTPGPVRGEIVRQIGLALRAKKEQLGAVVTLEMGKIKSEGLGEV